MLGSVLTFLVCGCSRPSFVHALQSVVQSHFDLTSGELLLPFPPIQRLSMHACQTLPASVYHHLLPHLPELTHLVFLSLISLMYLRTSVRRKLIRWGYSRSVP